MRTRLQCRQLRSLMVVTATLGVSVSHTAPFAAQLQADRLLVVDCLLPGQQRKLGGSMSYIGPRRPMRATVDDCEIRGGEYIAYDRANYSTALGVWMPLAQHGDAQAQVYVGEIYEKGLGIAPDYGQAAGWYQKAAEQHDSQGLNHLAYLYEQGLGVARDPLRALNLYRAASGITSDELTFASDVAAVRDEGQAKIDALTAQIQEQDHNAQGLSDQLEQTRQQLRDQRQRASKLEHDTSLLRQQSAQLRAAASPSNAAELQQLKSTIAAREAELSTQRLAVDKLEHDSAQQDDALRTRLAETQRQDALLQQQLGAANAAAAETRSQLDDAQIKAKSLEQSVSDLKAQVKSTESTLVAGEERLRQQQVAKSDADHLHQDELKSTITRQQIELDRQKAVIASLDAQRQKFESEARQLGSASTNAQSESAKAQAAAAQNAGTAAQLRAQLASVQSDLIRATAAANDKSAQLDLADRQLADANRRLDAAGTGSRTQVAELQRLNAEIQKREVDLASQRAELAAVKQSVANDRTKALDINGKILKADALDPTRGPAAAHLTAGGMPPNWVKPPDFAVGQNYAVIVGNTNYAHLPPLKTAAKDAQDVARVLTDRYGFGNHTRVLLDATRAQIMNALNDTMKTLTENDSLVIYYAGHGALDASNQRGYWLPIDADKDSPANWVSDRSITDMISLMSARHVLVVADSCYSGAMLHSTSTRLVSTGSPSPEKALLMYKWISKLRSRTVLTSGGNEPVLDSGSDGNSIFAREFIDALKQNMLVIEGASLYNTVSQRIQSSLLRWNAVTGTSVNEIPRYSMLDDAGHGNGDFLFVPNNGTAVTSRL